MPGPLAMLGIQTGLGVGQSILGNRAAKRQQQRMDEEAAQNKLISSFSKNAQPQQMGPQQGPGIAQQALADPLTKQLMAQLIGKGVGALGSGGNRIVSSGGGGSGAPGAGGFMNYMTP
jgi:hypothetical protein